MERICTTIEQSKKLIELGFDVNTADMHYVLIDSDEEIYDIGVGNYIGILPHYPAWSLAALLGALPKNLNIGRPSLESNYKGYYWIQYYDEFMKPNNYKTECFNNPVDACVELIIKLKEQNLL